MKKNFKKIIETIAITSIVGLVITIIDTYFSGLAKSVHAVLLYYPFISGVIFSCLFAFISILIILMLANDNNKDNYINIFTKYEKGLLYLTMSILFYIAIHLASMAFYEIGVPFFSEPYDRADIFRYVSPQDIFLSLLAISVISLVFIFAPNIPTIRRWLSIHIPLHELKPEYKHFLLRFSWVKKKINLLIVVFIIFLILSLIISIKIIPSLPEFTENPHDESQFLFNWDEIPGNDSKTLEDILRLDYNICWIETAVIEKIEYNKAIKVSNKNNSLFLRLNDENTNVTLKIDERIAEKFFANKLDGELKIYSQTIEQAKPNKSAFRNFFIGSFIVSILLYLSMFKNNYNDILYDIKKIKNDFRDLIIYYCTIPAIFVASLVLSGNKLVEYPNIPGLIVVGLIFISGFFTYITFMRIYISLSKKPYIVLICLAIISFVEILFFSFLFLYIVPDIIKDNFKYTLNIIVIIIILISIYSFFYEKLEKYKFTEWWKEWKPIAIIISMIVIFIVSAIDTDTKSIIIIFVVIFLILLPMIIGWIKFRKFKLFKLPKYHGMVLVEAETSPEKLKKLKDTLSSIDGLYNTKVIMGEYDLCLNIEGLDLDDIAKKVLKIREIEGIISTTTFIDINEFFD